MKRTQFFWLSAIVFTGCLITCPLRDPDLWWHLVAGRWILSHHAVPRIDYWNTYAAGKPWIDYSWLAQIVFAVAEKLGGLKGVMLLQLLLAIAVPLGLACSYHALARDWFYAAAAAIVASLCLPSEFALRPQTITWILFAAAIALSVRVDRQGLGWREGVLFAALGAIWVNIHVSLAFAYLAPVFWIGRWNMTRRLFFRSPAIVCAACFFAGSLISPYFPRQFTATATMSRDLFIYARSTEMLPATMTNPAVPVLFVVFILVLYLAHLRNRRDNLLPLCACGLLTIAALSWIKFVPYAMVALCAQTALFLSDSAILKGTPIGVGFGKLKQRVLSLSAVSMHSISTIGFIAALSTMVVLYRHPVDLLSVPVDAVDFVIDNNLPRPLAHQFDLGGYLIYRFAGADGMPGEKVILDGRLAVDDSKVLDAATNAQWANSQWRELFELTGAKTAIYPEEGALTQLLLASGEWKKEFSSKARLGQLVRATAVLTKQR